MSSEKQIDDYINGLDEKNQIYIEEELEYADKCHKLEAELGCSLDVVFKALNQDYIYTKRGMRQYIELGIYGMEWCICYGLKVQLRTADYKKTWWLKKDKSE